MRGKAYIVDNIEEITDAQDLGIAPPEELLSIRDFYFRPSDVMNFFKDDNGDISIRLKGEQNRWEIEYSDSVWDKLANSFS